MSKIHYFVSGQPMRCHDAAILLDGEEPLAVLVEAVVQTVSTDIEVTCGGYTMHLAAWEDPWHWSDDWAEKGVDPGDVDGIVAAAVGGDA